MFSNNTLTGILAFTLAAACGNALADPSRLDTILDSGKLRVCTTGDYPPFSRQTGDGSFEGIDIDFARSLGKALGVETQFVKTAWPTLMDDFSTHCDIAMGGISVTLERLKKAAFSEPHMIDGHRALRRCPEISKLADDRLAVDARHRQSRRHQRALCPCRAKASAIDRAPR